MFSATIVLASLLAAVSAQTTVTLVNNCGAQVDPAFFPAVSNGTQTGGFALAAGDRRAVTLGAGYAGRVWGRTGCNAAGNCTTGTCPGGEECAGPAPGVLTVVQLNINSYASLDFFNLASAAGANLKVKLAPVGNCTTAAMTCETDGTGAGCGQTLTCPTGTEYNVEFC